MGGKKALLWVGGLLVALLALPGSAHASLGNLNVRSYILVDAADGKVLQEHNPDMQIPPASVTKILTLYMVYEAIESGKVHPWDKVPISKNAANTGGTRMFLKAGTEVPLEELMKGMAIFSGNDACIAVAEYLGGSVEEFVREMNIKARTLGMTNSVFINPNGLPARGQVTTARDMAKLSIAYLKRFPESLHIHSLPCYSYNRHTQSNRNRLIGKCLGVDGIKTGFVCASGYNFSATAKRGDTRLISVVLGAPSPGVRAAATARIMEEGFAMMAPHDSGITVTNSAEVISAEYIGPPKAAHSPKKVRQARKVLRAGHPSAAVFRMEKTGTPAASTGVKAHRNSSRASLQHGAHKKTKHVTTPRSSSLNGG